MTEERFISQNKYDWDKYQTMLDEWRLYSPNELGQAYLCVCSDLAYAQSHYPETELCSNLNALALQFHHILYRRQPQRWSELLYFFRYTVPTSFHRSKHFLLLSLVLFALGQVVGVVDTGYKLPGTKYKLQTTRYITDRANKNPPCMSCNNMEDFFAFRLLPLARTKVQAGTSRLCS